MKDGLRDYLEGLGAWWDGELMSAMFSALRPREDNDLAHDRKMVFWSEVLLGAAERGVLGSSPFLIQVDAALPLRFERKGKIPACLDVVLQSLITDRKLLLVSEEQHSFLGKLWQLTLWLWKDSEPVKQTVYSARLAAKIHDCVIKEASEDNEGFLLEEDLRDVVPEVFALLGLLEPETREVEAVIRHLAGQMGAVGSKGEQIFPTKDILGDRLAVLGKLARNKRVAKTACVRLDNDLAELDTKIRLLLVETKKERALAEFKRKKHLEKDLELQTATLHNIEEMERKLRQAYDNQTLQTVMRQTADVMAEVKIDVDALENDLEEIYSVTAEMEAIAEQLSGMGLSESNAALEQELEDMCREQETVKDKKILQEKEVAKEETTKEETKEEAVAIE